MPPLRLTKREARQIVRLWVAVQLLLLDDVQGFNLDDMADNHTLQDAWEDFGQQLLRQVRHEGAIAPGTSWVLQTILNRRKRPNKGKVRS